MWQSMKPANYIVLHDITSMVVTLPSLKKKVKITANLAILRNGQYCELQFSKVLLSVKWDNVTSDCWVFLNTYFNNKSYTYDKLGL